MKLFLLSDIHSSFNLHALKDKIKKEKADATVVAGDITHFGTVEEFKEILRAIDTGKPLIYVPGNCDPTEALDIDYMINIHGKKFDYLSYTFVGFGGSNPTPFSTRIEFEPQIAKKELEKLIVGEKNLILVSHSPPFGTKADISMGRHVGNPAIRSIVERFEPILVVCGHIHESRAIDRVGRTFIVNPGPASKGFYAISEIDNDVNIKLRSFIE